MVFSSSIPLAKISDRIWIPMMGWLSTGIRMLKDGSQK